MTLYISGKMRGLPDGNAPAFNEAAERLRSLGYKVINPVEVGKELERMKSRPTDDDYLLADLEAMRKCHKVVLLPNWFTSKGVQVELAFAAYRGIPIVRYEDLLEYAA